MTATEADYVNPGVADRDNAYVERASRINRRLDAGFNDQAEVLNALTAGPRSMGYFEFIAGRPADTEEIEIDGLRVYFDGGTPDPTADITVDISGTADLDEDLAATAAAVAAHAERDFDVFVIDNLNAAPTGLCLGVWYISNPDNTVPLDATGCANAVAGAATLLQGVERSNMIWADQYEITAEDVAALAGTGAGSEGQVLAAVFPYQGASLSLASVTFLDADGFLIVPLTTHGATVAQVAIDGTDRYWGLFIQDTAATLAATNVVGFVVVAD